MQFLSTREQGKGRKSLDLFADVNAISIILQDSILVRPKEDAAERREWALPQYPRNKVVWFRQRHYKTPSQSG